MNRTARALACMSLGMALFGCRPALAPNVSGRMPQRGYLWQRNWTTSVEQAFLRAEERLDGLILLGGEVVWEEDAPRLVKSSIRWETVAQTGKSCGLALRVAPYRGAFVNDDANARFLAATAKALLAEAAAHGVRASEFQLDFDCPQKKLGGYAHWVSALRSATHPVPLSITALPSWLEEQEFRKLIGEVDNYVLQVHSVPARGADNRETLCDPRLAKAAAAKAARLGRRFSVALPTYRCLAGYDVDGKLLAVAMDSVQPNWPGGTRVLEFTSDPAQLAGLVHDWNAARPALLQSVIWYRAPTNADARNWRWPTLNAVMEGRVPTHKLSVAREGENPVDLFLANEGEAEEQFAGSVTASWTQADLLAADAVANWTVHIGAGRAVFATEAEARLRLLPGERRAIGWLRYDRPAQPELVLTSTTR